jgi:transcriptional regulator with XRE-family HTH domain
MTNQEFAAALREALRQKGCTQSELARAVKVAKGTVSRWVKGEDQPHGRYLHAMAAFLDAPHLALGEEGQTKIDRRVVEILTRIAERLLVGQGIMNATEREAARGDPTEEERQVLMTAAPLIRKELMEAAAGDWEALTEAERQALLERLALEHLAFRGAGK